MDNRSDNFASGFVAGAFFGSMVGAAVGALLGSKLSNESFSEDEPPVDKTLGSSPPKKVKKYRMKASDELSIEEARRGLEEKIAQLNDAIDSVRHQLSDVNGNVQE